MRAENVVPWRTRHMAQFTEKLFASKCPFHWKGEICVNERRLRFSNEKSAGNKASVILSHLQLIFHWFQSSLSIGKEERLFNWTSFALGLHWHLVMYLMHQWGTRSCVRKTGAARRMWDQATSVTCVHSSRKNEKRSAQFVPRDFEASLEILETPLAECKYLRAFLIEGINLGPFLMLGRQGNQGYQEASLWVHQFQLIEWNIESCYSERGCQKSALINSASLWHFSHVIIEESDKLFSVLLACLNNSLLPQLRQSATLPYAGLICEKFNFLRKQIFKNLRVGLFVLGLVSLFWFFSITFLHTYSKYSNNCCSAGKEQDNNLLLAFMSTSPA